MNQESKPGLLQKIKLSVSNAFDPERARKEQSWMYDVNGLENQPNGQPTTFNEIDGRHKEKTTGSESLIDTIKGFLSNIDH